MSHRKPPDKRQNRITRDLQLVQGGLPETPPAPESLSPRLTEHWRELWEAPIAAAWDPGTDRRVIERLFSLYALRDQAIAAIERDGMIVEGSQGQPVDHPMTRRMKDLDGEIRQLEDRLGLNPKARLQLGVSGAQMKRLSELSTVKPESLSDDPRTRREAG